MTNLKTKELVKLKKISPKEAYDRLLPLVGNVYSTCLPTMIWLNNIINNKNTNTKITKQEKKQLPNSNTKK